MTLFASLQLYSNSFVLFFFAVDVFCCNYLSGYALSLFEWLAGLIYVFKMICYLRRAVNMLAYGLFAAYQTNVYKCLWTAAYFGSRFTSP